MRVSGVFIPFTVRTLAPVEIFASKIAALNARAAVRDLYDINNMVYYGLFDDSETMMLRKCAVFYMAVSGDVTTHEFGFERIANITLHKVKTDLNPIQYRTIFIPNIFKKYIRLGSG
jgi:predicted nucleotidyltransferase component of viral defense system